MFAFDEPSDLKDDWYLGDQSKRPEKISNKLLKNISNAHILGVQFLFDNFMKNRGGAILNQEEDLNMPLQVCIFLSSIKEKLNENSPVLIITSEYSLCKWHYHASEVGFIPKIITPDNSDYGAVLYFLNSESLKLAEKLSSDLFCVVIDDFDLIATKTCIKKIRRSFNIGLTTRSFYKRPDQKLKWSMLNWISPGCVGKLKDFYRIDREHSAAFADNYRYWWMRLTWKFCESFEPPNEEYTEEYRKKLQEWGSTHNLRFSPHTKKGTKRAIYKKPSSTELKRMKTSVENSPTSSCSTDKSELNSESKFYPDEVKKSVDSEIVESMNCNIDFSSKEKNDSSSEELMPRDEGYNKPISSIINSKTSLKSEDDSSINEAPSNIVDSDSNFFSFLLDDSSTHCESSSQPKDISYNLSDTDNNIKDDSDDNTFFSELVLGKN